MKYYLEIHQKYCRRAVDSRTDKQCILSDAGVDYVSTIVYF